MGGSTSEKSVEGVLFLYMDLVGLSDVWGMQKPRGMHSKRPSEVENSGLPRNDPHVVRIVLSSTPLLGCLAFEP